jgi:hypothetical protein
MTPNRRYDQPGAIKSTWQHETSLMLAFFFWFTRYVREGSLFKKKATTASTLE